MQALSPSLFIHGINRYLPRFGVLLWVISEAEFSFILLECFDGCFGSHYDNPLNNEQLVVVLNQRIQNPAKV